MPRYSSYLYLTRLQNEYHSKRQGQEVLSRLPHLYLHDPKQLNEPFPLPNTEVSGPHHRTTRCPFSAVGPVGADPLGWLTPNEDSPNEGSSARIKSRSKDILNLTPGSYPD